MRKGYFDQAATSHPKAPGVAEAMVGYLTGVGSNVGRGGYQAAYQAADRVVDVREGLCALLGGPAPRNVIFTPGCTHSLGYVLKGLLRPGDRVLTSTMEHNAVLRPLHQLAQMGVEVDTLPCNEQGELLLEEVAGQLDRAPTRLVVLTHASNVCGTILPVAAVGALCRQRGVFFCVDAAQTAGILPIHMGEMGMDALAFPAHKGLLGPQGLGGLILTNALAGELTPLIAGGTGSRSDSVEMPGFLPDRLEAGTLNLPGIYGLGAALAWLREEGADALRQRERRLTGHLIARLSEMEGPDWLHVLGTGDAHRQVGVVSVDFAQVDNATVSFRLEEEYGIQTRCGLHCAPLAHQTLGTFPQGTVRFSIGPMTTFEDIDYLQGALCEIMGI